MDKIVILDFGGQYAHLIANRIRRIGVYSEILDPETSADELKEYKGIILSGGPASVSADDSPKCDPEIFNLGVPVLGICYGHQMTAHLLGGSVKPGETQEYGQAEVEFLERKGIFEDINEKETAWMSHFDQVEKLPEGFSVVAKTDDCPVAAMADYKRNIYTLQFHPEVTHTPCGMKILKKFVEITGASPDWNIEDYTEVLIEEIREKVGNNKVFMLVSGGVDSSVAFLLLDKALGQENVYGLFVDTGFMRLNEREEVEKALKEAGVENLHVYDAGKEYFEALKGVYGPEKKREIIGNLFIEIQKKVSDELELDSELWMLGQGTIYPDTIETGGTKHAQKIKTHHNRVEAIRELIDKGKVIEPIAQFYKDEVRVIGKNLGLNEEMVWRHPFPGPGLAVRCLCTKAEDYPENYLEIEDSMKEFLSENNCKAKILPIKSVGVQGDERTYRHPVLLYGKEFNWDELSMLTTRLTNRYKEVNRVVWGLNNIDFDAVSTQNNYMTGERILTIQKADKAVMDFILEKNLNRDIWQFPTVLLPVSFGGSKKESIVLRPVSSEEAMTASFYQMENSLLKELTQRLEAIDEVGGILYDVTNKPPGTIEWE
ncbi:glutamine-hydrolyzing GMP synthase [Candidatus Peregrinibacteria bacterium]|nr:glutamine-hydrolyzing GMP synthase [Candidatus Peregrinibacteria bacterium]